MSQPRAWFTPREAPPRFLGMRSRAWAARDLKKPAAGRCGGGEGGPGIAGAGGEEVFLVEGFVNAAGDLGGAGAGDGAVAAQHHHHHELRMLDAEIAGEQAEACAVTAA